MPKAQTKRTWKTYLVGFLLSFSFRFTDERFNHGRVDHFVYDHMWLVVFLPMALLALFLFVRGFYLEYKA